MDPSLLGARPDEGGDSSAVQDQLRNVQQVHATFFEHLLQSWQMDLSLLGAIQIDGGDSSAVQDQLGNVQQVHATSCAFAAILADGSVLTWGGPDRWWR